MTNPTGIWYTNPKASTRSLRSTWFGSTVAVISTIFLIFSSNASSTMQFLYFISIAIIYTLVCRLLVRSYFYNKRSGRFFTIRNGILLIPRAVFKNYHINILEIKSIETYNNSKEILGVLIGRLEKSSVLVERTSFQSSEDFLSFINFLNQVVADNNSKKTGEDHSRIQAKNATKGNFSPTIFSLIFAAVYILFSSSGFDTISPEALLNGALTKDLMSKKEFYRFTSSFFLHYSPYHLGVNILGISVIGRYVDVVFGKIRFLLILLGSALAGALASLLFSPFSFVIGASGGILGLFGAYFVACVKKQESLPGSVSLSLRTLSFILAAQILVDLIAPDIDIISHIAGFLTGACYAILIFRRRDLKLETSSSSKDKYAAFLLSSIFLAGIYEFFLRNFPNLFEYF